MFRFLNGMTFDFIKKNIMKKTLLIAVLALFISGIVHAQKVEVVTSNRPGWHKIGETTVNFKSDKDAIYVIGADKFKSLFIKVTDAPLRVDGAEVYFDNENKQEVEVNTNFKAGTKSRIIDLIGGERSLKKVVFYYKTIPNMQVDKAHVELWGLK